MHKSKLYSFLYFFLSVPMAMALDGPTKAASSILFREVPELIRFADQSLSIRPGAQKTIGKKFKGLTLSPQHFQDYVERCNLYFPLIQEVFEEENLPLDFRFLALQESALVATAVSKSNAVGYWQFKDFTAIEMQMRVDNQIDLRKHIVEASRGAARYLKNNNIHMRNWTYAMLSYNLGLTGARNYLKQDFRDVKNLSLDEYTHLYIIHFLAHKLAFENQVGKKESSITLLEYPKASGKTLSLIASESGIPLAQLREYNHWLTASVIPEDRAYSVILPVPTERVQEVAASLDLSIPGKEKLMPPTIKAEPRVIEVIVQEDNPYPIISKTETKKFKDVTVTLVTANGIEGLIAGPDHTVKQITEAMGIKEKSFRKWNDLSASDELKESQVYYLKAKSGKGPVPFHTVVEESNLWEVAQRYGMKLKSLAKFNRMEKTAAIKQTRVLWLQKKRPKKTPVEYRDLPTKTITLPGGEPNKMEEKDTDVKVTPGDTLDADSLENIKANKGYHVVKENENLFIISRKYNVTILDLKEWNSLSSDLALTGGQILRVSPPGEGDQAARNEGKGANKKYDPENPISLKDILTEDVERVEGKDPLKEPDPNTPALKKPSQLIHTVKSGESLATIAKQYGVEQLDIMTWNNLPSQSLNINQQLIIKLNPVGLPSTGEEKAPIKTDQPVIDQNKNSTQPITKSLSSSAKTHIIEGGQTLYSISKLYSISINDLMLWNPTTDPSSLSVGQELFVSDPNQAISTTNDPFSQPAGENTNPIYDQPAGSQTADSTPSYDQPATNPDSESKATRPKPASGYHTVQKGETLFDIGVYYSISPADLRKWNNLSSSTVSTGQKIAVLAALAVVTDQPAKTEPTPTMTGTGSPTYHTVAKGETLYSISKMYNQSLKDLQSWNNIVGGNIKYGQKLIVGNRGGKVPVTSKNNPSGSTVYHTVAKGENLFRISLKYNVKMEQIRRLNNMSDNNVKLGQKLRIK